VVTPPEGVLGAGVVGAAGTFVGAGGVLGPAGDRVGADVARDAAAERRSCFCSCLAAAGVLGGGVCLGGPGSCVMRGLARGLADGL